MSAGAESMAERHGRMLAEAAEIMLAAMHRLAERIEAAETPEAARDAALALQRVNRGLRQTILLEAKLAKDAADAGRRREERDEAERKARAKQAAAKLKVRARGVILEACDSRDTAEPLLDDLEFWADDYVAGADGAGLDELVVRLCRDLGIDFAPHELPAAMRAAASQCPAAEHPPSLVQTADYGWAAAPNSS